MKPSVNNRELALSPGRVPETLAINKEETINIHHSPLRSRAGANSSSRNTHRDRSSRQQISSNLSRPPTCDALKKVISAVEKPSRSARPKKTKSRSKSSRPKTAKQPKPDTTKGNLIKKEFESFKRGLNKKESEPRNNVI